MGGTVNINFNRPTDHYQTKLAVEGGNYDFFHVTAVQNIPVSNDLAIRGAVDYARHSGYQESGANSQNDFVGRLSALFTPMPSRSMSGDRLQQRTAIRSTSSRGHSMQPLWGCVTGPIFTQTIPGMIRERALWRLWRRSEQFPRSIKYTIIIQSVPNSMPNWAALR